MSDYLFDLWVPAFISTILIEAPIVALFVRQRLTMVAALALGIAFQAVTHPVFWLSWDALEAWPYDNYELALGLFESTIVLVEAGLIWLALPTRRAWQRLPNGWLALIASLVANATSVVVGMLHHG